MRITLVIGSAKLNMTDFGNLCYEAKMQALKFSRSAAVFEARGYFFAPFALCSGLIAIPYMVRRGASLL